MFNTSDINSGKILSFQDSMAESSAPRARTVTSSMFSVTLGMNFEMLMWISNAPPEDGGLVRGSDQSPRGMKGERGMVYTTVTGLLIESQGQGQEIVPQGHGLTGVLGPVITSERDQLIAKKGIHDHVHGVDLGRGHEIVARNIALSLLKSSENVRA